MKKSFLMFGFLAALCAFNVYAEDAISPAPEVDEATVARAAKVVAKPVKTINVAPVMPEEPGVVEKAAIGEVRPNGENGWVGCPPDCVFTTYADGTLACVRGGIECPGINGGIRYYEGDKPTVYSIGPTVPTPSNLEPVSIASQVQQRADKVSIDRAAKSSVKIKKNPEVIKPTMPKIEEKAASGAVGITCPAHCTPNCAVLGNTVLCDCRDSNNNLCAEEVVQTSNTDVTHIR